MRVKRAKKGALVGVLRGASWNNEARRVRAGNRDRNDPVRRNDNNGFRCAVPPSTAHSLRRARIRQVLHLKYVVDLSSVPRGGERQWSLSGRLLVA